MQMFYNVMEIIGFAVDGVGVLTIVIGALLATVRFLNRRAASTYTAYRHDLGRSILLGLEFLIAGDIIRTVVVAPKLNNLATLGIIVVIRISLSMALYLEIEGRWPWQQDRGSALACPEEGDPGRGAA